MSSYEFAFSSLGKFLRSDELSKKSAKYQLYTEMLYRAEKELFSDIDLSKTMRSIRQGLLNNIKFESESQFRLLGGLALLIILPESYWADIYSKSKGYVEGEIYSGKRFAEAQKHLVKTSDIRKTFAPILNEPIFGQKLYKKIERLAIRAQSVSADYLQVQQLARFLSSPSVLLLELEKAWPDKPLKELLECFVSDLNIIPSRFSKEARFKKYWVNYQKYKSQVRRKSKKTVLNNSSEYKYNRQRPSSKTQYCT